MADLHKYPPGSGGCSQAVAAGMSRTTSPTEHHDIPVCVRSSRVASEQPEHRPSDIALGTSGVHRGIDRYDVRAPHRTTAPCALLRGCAGRGGDRQSPMTGPRPIVRRSVPIVRDSQIKDMIGAARPGLPVRARHGSSVLFTLERVCKPLLLRDDWTRLDVIHVLGKRPPSRPSRLAKDSQGADRYLGSQSGQW